MVKRYVSPFASRARASGVADDLVARLMAARRKVARGATLLEVVADGTASGWRLRLALSNALGVPLANWDVQPGRTQLERAAVVERVLGEFGQRTLALGGVR